jgi:deazaflavin-dependent oxidoreductase (nitroreductase family)
MTAERAATVSTPPRILIRTFWVLHRALHRLSGGRIGLSRPVAGEKFGMLRLTTIGRRSGQARVAIIGYIEDGSDVVTVAMNGWGEAEPAWWLNLQAHPEAVVELAEGRRREVRGRAAVGDERERLWRSMRELDENLDGYAARRPHETAVVVFEERPETTTISDEG